MPVGDILREIKPYFLANVRPPLGVSASVVMGEVWSEVFLVEQLKGFGCWSHQGHGKVVEVYIMVEVLSL